MTEAFILALVMCSPNAISINQCQAMISRNVVPSEEACIIELMEQALPWVTAQGLVVVDFSCASYTLPFDLNEPA